ncbi:MAG: hypothetical protein OSB03_13060 [Vicinamibacterales bacterium]|jgi:hypothetical protein|nr:hypothetical protein [Vicinamibacterales bacterium]
MTPSPETVRLGVVGGCLTHQDGIPLSKLYHRRLAASLRDEAGIRLQVRVARDFQRPYLARLESLLETHHLDGVLLNMRVAMTNKGTLLSRNSADGIARYSLHPFMFNSREVGWAESQSRGGRGVTVVRRPAGRVGAEEHLQARSGRHIFGFRVNDLNLILRHLIGLDDWAIRDEMAMLSQFARACEVHQLPFIVLGSSLLADVPQVNRLAARIAERARALLLPMNVPYCAIDTTLDENGQPILLPDGYHLSENGHRYVARQLRSAVEDWARHVVASREQTLAGTTVVPD